MMCPACGRPSNEALNEISRKVRRLQLVNVMKKWTLRGAEAGFVTAMILTSVFAVSKTFSDHVRSVYYDQHAEPQVVDPVIQTWIFFSVVGLVLPALFAILAFVIATLIRPIVIALFCSVERFEQEYGPSRK
jgi:hypothetical protein